jgi:hypothetical protein
MTTQTEQQQANRAPKHPAPRSVPDTLAGFEVKDGEQVKKILRQRPMLAPLLVEMMAEIHKHFPEAERVVLAPEWESPGNLVARVMTHVEDAVASEERFDDAWTFPRWESHQGRLLLNVLAP